MRWVRKKRAKGCEVSTNDLNKVIIEPDGI